MITKVEIKDIWKIQKVAHNTWPNTFKDILSEAQLYYMLDLMYNSQELTAKIEEGHLFYVFETAGEVKGFVGFKVSQSYLNIHKLYVIPSFQGQSIGKQLMHFAIQQAQAEKLEFVELNVNRFNSAVDFYTKNGFEIVETEDIEIGNGYLMEDYKMQYKL